MSIHQTERAVWAAATAIPGLVPTEFTPVEDVQTMIRASGWSPSLHAIRMEFTVPVGMEDANRLIAAIQPFLERQRRRSAEAEALDVGLPRHPRDPDMPITHLHADASLLALAVYAETTKMRERHGVDENEAGRVAVADVIHDCRGRVGIAHMLQNVYDGGATLLDGGCRVAERGAIRTVDMPGATITNGGHRIHVSPRDPDTILHLDASLPDATLAAIVGGRMNGRPLRDLAIVDRIVDDRIVSGASRPRNGSGLIVALRPCPVRLADIEGMDANETIDHLVTAMTTNEGRSG